MKLTIRKYLSKSLSVPLFGLSVLFSGLAHATATDANVCQKMEVPIIGVGANGNPTHYNGNVIATNSDSWVTCGIPNSYYLGSSASVDIYVDDRSGAEDFACTFIVRDLSTFTHVGSDTVTSSGTGQQTITANVSTSGYNTRDLSYTVECSIPQIFGTNFISALMGFHLY